MLTPPIQQKRQEQIARQIADMNARVGYKVFSSLQIPAKPKLPKQ